MKKKICFFVGNMNNAGGTERVCSIIANELANAGYEIVILSLSEGMQPFFSLNKNIKIRSLFPQPGRTLYRTPVLIYKLRKFLIKEKIETLIVVETMSVLFTLPAVQGLAINHICWEHFNFKNDNGKTGRRLARHLAARYCNYVVTLTERDKSFWLNRTSHKANIVAIPNPSPFKPKVLGQKNEDKIVLAVGRVTYVKGFDLLIESWKLVSDKFPDWKLVIVGKGEEESNLKRLINKYGLFDTILLAGHTDDIGYYYNSASIFCLSSRYEGFPMVLLEALSFGVPIVSFDCDTGPAEILEGTGSILVPTEDTNQLTQSLIQLIKNKDLREKISSKSMQKSLEYQPEKIIKEWQKLI